MSDEIHSLFLGTEISEAYKKYRPVPPIELLNKILPYLSEKVKPPFEQAVDVGCGSGQNTQLLGPHFKKVIGIDVSSDQIEQAKKNEQQPNITYSVGQAESLPIESGSTQLITVCQAAHWLNIPEFYKEVDRILVPGGVLAMFSHVRPLLFYKNFSEELQAHMNTMFDVTTGKYWHRNRELVDNYYKDIALPYKDQIRDHSVYKEIEYLVTEIAGYIRSWSSFQSYKRDNPQKAEEALQAFQTKILEIIKEDGPPEEIKVIMRWNYCLLISRKPI